MKSYLTSWLAQNLSKRVLKRLPVLTSATWLRRLFQILTMRAEKNGTFVGHNEICNWKIYIILFPLVMESADRCIIYFVWKACSVVRSQVAT